MSLFAYASLFFVAAVIAAPLGFEWISVALLICGLIVLGVGVLLHVIGWHP